MPLLSGKDGAVRIGGAEVAITRWRLARIARTRSYTTNATGATPRRVPGAKTCSGRFALKLAESTNLPVEGDAVELELHVDGSGANYYALSAIVAAVRVVVDVSTGLPIGCLVSFSANGPLAAHGILAKKA